MARVFAHLHHRAVAYGHRSVHETMLTEIGPLLCAIRRALSNLRRWMKPQRRHIDRLAYGLGSNTVIPQPLGVVGIIVLWNFTDCAAQGGLVFMDKARQRAQVCLALGQVGHGMGQVGLALAPQMAGQLVGHGRGVWGRRLLVNVRVGVHVKPLVGASALGNSIAAPLSRSFETPPGPCALANVCWTILGKSYCCSLSASALKFALGPGVTARGVPCQRPGWHDQIATLPRTAWAATVVSVQRGASKTGRAAFRPACTPCNLAKLALPMEYLVIKTLHQAAVALSVAGFFARGWGSLAGAEWTRRRLVRTLPHVIDTGLLASALLLAWILRLTPAAAPWLAAKIIGLLVYIALGMLALRPGRSAPVRAAAWIAALLTFAWIVSVAITKNPVGFFAHTLPGL